MLESPSSLPPATPEIISSPARLITVDRAQLSLRIQELQQNPEIFESTYQQIITELLQNTSVLSLFEQLGMMADIQGAFDNQVGDSRVLWNQTHIPTSGRHDFVAGVTRMRSSPPTKADITTSLALTGEPPSALDILAHELLHDAQSPDSLIPRLLFVLINGSTMEDVYRPGLEFLEIVAYRLTSMETDEASTAQLIHGIKTICDRQGNLLYPHFEDAQLLQACQLVDQLLALGESSLDICKLAIDGGGWDNQTNTYPDINLRIQERCKSKKNIPYPQGLTLLIKQYHDKKWQDKCLAQQITLNKISYQLSSSPIS